ncbi:MAG: glutathione S-transferase family protein [Pseudomonadota bacterium]
MGQLIDGVWHTDNQAATDGKGAFKRSNAGFRNWVSADGSAGPSGDGGFKAESGRYHLYVAWACPWAHRTLIFRALKGLEEHISVSFVGPIMLDQGWEFADREDCTPDHILGKRYLHEVYTAADGAFTGRVTVPVLWDKAQGTICSNESSEIIRMFNSAFNSVTGNEDDYYPQALRAEIDGINDRVYNTLNNGVYKSGFARTQEAYNDAVVPLFDTLDWLEGILSEKRYLTGSQLTEADWRLWPTLLRFDPVYHGHFKCNIRCLREYPNLWGYTRELYQWPGIAETVHMAQTKEHYYASHLNVNPTGIVPSGPDLDLSAPHGRDRL